MATHHIEVIGIVFLLVFAATMFYQGTMILHQKQVYSKKYIKRDLERMRLSVEEVIKNAKN